MRLLLRGHDRRYAAEQMLLTLFPDEKPVYDEAATDGDSAVLTMRRGGTYTTCLCELTLGGSRYAGSARVRNSTMTDETAADRLENRIVKASLYRAALASGIVTPEWGSLTGVRPAKLLTALLEGGASPRAAMSAFRRDYDVSAERAQLCLDAALAALDVKAALAPGDICLYIGIPFCPTRCAYCSFVSQSVEKSMALIDPFLDALMDDIEETAAAVSAAGLRPVSIYMGGGTPTTLSAAQLDALCSKLQNCFNLLGVREYTVEAGRPDTITPEKLAVLVAHGVSRISVNPQTMEDPVLEAIGRRHTAADVLRALETARAAGGFEVNMDLIAGLPGDTVAGFGRTLETVLSLAPENVTVHTLSRKRGARLDPADGSLPSARDVGKMLDIARVGLAGKRYAPYYLYRQKFMSGGFENVGWTLGGHRNLYNICMMEELCGIISMGAGGSTKLISGGERLLRLCAPKYPLEYINGAEKRRADKKRIEAFYGVRSEGN